MSGNRTAEQHSCFDSADHVLGKQNTRLTFAMQLPSGEERLVIATEKVDDKKRGAVVRMMANFCPFCGRHLP